MELNEQYYQNLIQTVFSKLQAAVAEGIAFYPQIEKFLDSKELGHTEFALGARYLHRGFYCPSPDLECIIDNVRRGKIAKRMTKASKPTNCYMFDTNGALFLADTFYPNGATETEYILRKENVTFGFSYDKFGNLGPISIEEQLEGQKNYLYAYCTQRNEGKCFFTNIVYEKVTVADSRAETDIYSIADLRKRILITRWKAVYNADDNGMPVLESRELVLYEKLIKEEDGSLLLKDREEYLS